MKIRAIVVGDPHVWHTAPQARVDNYQASIFAKLEEIRDYANAIPDLSFVQFLGDLFKNKKANPPYFLTYQLSDYFNSFNAPVYTLVGNHDMEQVTTLDGLWRYPIAAVARQSTLKIVDVFELSGIKFVQLHFKEGYDSGDPKVIQDEIDKLANRDKFAVYFIHASILPEPYGRFPFVPLKDLNYVGLLFCGHLHFNWEKVECKNVLSYKAAYSPGSISRFTGFGSSEGPRGFYDCTISDFDSDGVKLGFDVNFIPLKAVKPLKEILNTMLKKQKTAVVPKDYINALKEEITFFSFDEFLEREMSRLSPEDRKLVISFMSKVS